MSKRMSWEEYALNLAKVASLRSEDPRTQVGCCLLRYDNTVASLGYNGAPPGVSIDWNNRDEKLRRVIHSEINALRMVKPGECYLAAVTHTPCNDCLKSLASYGIKRIVYSKEFAMRYDGDYDPHLIANDFGIELIYLPIQKE